VRTLVKAAAARRAGGAGYIVGAMGGEPRGRARGSRGAALVEFALVFPVLALLVLGTVDAGRAYITWNQAKNAAREGAAYAQLYPNRPTAGAGECADPDNVEYRAQAESGTDFSVATQRVDVSPAVSLAACVPASSTAAVPAGAEVRVTASRPFAPLTPFIHISSISADVTVVVQG
jgi:Flp pilus assembly protein TadG